MDINFTQNTEEFENKRHTFHTHTEKIRITSAETSGWLVPAKNKKAEHKNQLRIINENAKLLYNEVKIESNYENVIISIIFLLSLFQQKDPVIIIISITNLKYKVG